MDALDLNKHNVSMHSLYYIFGMSINFGLCVISYYMLMKIFFGVLCFFNFIGLSVTIYKLNLIKKLEKGKKEKKGKCKLKILI